MATIKYKDVDGSLVTVGAGVHTHSPSSIGAAEAEHEHDEATTTNNGFLSSTDKVKIDNLNDTVFGNTDKSLAGLVDLVGDAAVSEQISDAVSTASSEMLESAQDYTDTKIADLINSAPTTLDTLGEIADAMAENDNVVSALDEAIGTKADSEHTHELSDVTKLQENLNAKVPTSRTVNGYALSANISLTASDVGAADSDHAHDGRYYTEAEIDSKFDTLVGDTAVSTQISDHTAAVATQSTAGHMSAADKKSLDSLITQLGEYTIKYSTTVPTTNDTKVITLVPRG